MSEAAVDFHGVNSEHKRVDEGAWLVSEQILQCIVAAPICFTGQNM